MATYRDGEDENRPPNDWAGWTRNASDKEAFVQDSAPGLVTFIHPGDEED